MAAGILQAAGYRVGLYTSPHLVEFRERIRVDGVMIPEEAVARGTAAAQEAAGTDLQPTFFESTTAMAFRYFAEAQVDVAVLEVGLGGDFDGIPYTPEDLNGVEDYPVIFAELIRRGWSDENLAKLAGGNVLRALRRAEEVSASMKNEPAILSPVDEAPSQ